MVDFLSRREKRFLVVETSKIIFLCKILYPKRRIKSYSILGTIVSPKKILLKYACRSFAGDATGAADAYRKWMLGFRVQGFRV